MTLAEPTIAERIAKARGWETNPASAQQWIQLDPYDALFNTFRMTVPRLALKEGFDPVNDWAQAGVLLGELLSGGVICHFSEYEASFDTGDLNELLWADIGNAELSKLRGAVCEAWLAMMKAPKA